MILSSFLIRARSLGLACLALVLGAVSISAHAQQRAFAMRYTTTTAGNIVGIGNVNMHCDPTEGNATLQADCLSARTHTGGDGNHRNNNFTMRNINEATHSSLASFNSSGATLNLPAGSTVLFAGLYWSGRVADVAERSAIRFKVPGGAYAAVPSPVIDGYIGTSTAGYQGFSNVTSLVQAAGNGTYAVANIRSSEATDNWAGWSLVVAYSNPSEPVRNLSIFDGWQRAGDANNPINLTVSGFITPPSGTVNTTIGVLAWDGDRPGTDGGTGLRFGSSVPSLSDVSNAINPANNFWNSTISVSGAHVTAGRQPSYTNTLGMDLDFLPPNVPLPNNANSAVVSVRGASGEVVWTGMVSLATEVYAPSLVASMDKSVVDDNGGLVEPGDVLTYTVSFSNTGGDGATNVVVTDPIPAGVTYVAGSLEVIGNDTNDGGASNGGATGAMTDAIDGDVAEFNGTSVVFRMGRDDSTWDGGTGLSNGGMISAGGYSGSFRFKVRVNSDVAPGTPITNTASVAHNAQTLTGSDFTGSDAAEVTVQQGVDLSITKTTPVTSVASNGLVTYTITAQNVGSSNADGAVVSDDWTSVPGLDCATPASSLTCATAGGAGGCPSSPTPADLQAGIAITPFPGTGSVTFTLTCTVTATGTP